VLFRSPQNPKTPVFDLCVFENVSINPIAVGKL